MRDSRIAAALLVVGAAVGVTVAAAAAMLTDDDPKPRATAEIDAEVLVDATVIEMHGYDKNGEPGTYWYDCTSEKGKLVCTQREEDAG